MDRHYWTRMVANHQSQRTQKATRVAREQMAYNTSLAARTALHEMYSTHEHNVCTFDKSNKKRTKNWLLNIMPSNVVQVYWCIQLM